MKAFMLFTGGSPLVVLTSHPDIIDAAVLKKLTAKGITKFIAHEIPVDMAHARYGNHFNLVLNDLHETDDLRVLDFNGQRAFKLFGLNELGPPIQYEALEKV